MYSVVLMAALTANTADAPAFHKQRAMGCNGALFLHSGCYGSCNGCWGAWGNCMGGGCYGSCYGCMGCYGIYDGGLSTGYGAYGGWYGYGADYYGTPVTYPANNPNSTSPNPNATPDKENKDKKAGSAKVIIEKPIDAKIYVDDTLVQSEGARQTFATPTLDPQHAYYYTVRIESVRDGKPVSETRRVIVRAGETVQETFREPGIITAAAGN